MIMEMFIINLVNRFLYRRPYDPLPSDPDDNDENTKIDIHAAIAEEDVWKEEEEKEPAMLFYALWHHDHWKKKKSKHTLVNLFLTRLWKSK